VSKPIVKILASKNIVSLVKRSLGSPVFQNLYATVDGEEKDILQGGRFSCAFFISAILRQLELIKKGHAGVAGLEKDMIESGWQKIDKPILGSIVFYDPAPNSEDELCPEGHPHVGIYMGNDTVISNSTEERVPVEHHWTYDGTRKITAIYTHPEK